jgi:hypothetical protein
LFIAADLDPYRPAALLVRAGVRPIRSFSS